MTKAKARVIKAKLHKNLTFIRERMKKYYDPKRSKGLTFKEGDIVYLFSTHIK